MLCIEYDVLFRYIDMENNTFGESSKITTFPF